MLEVELVVGRREFDVEVAFSVFGGERFALYGPSGSGKTTILEAIAGLAPFGEGRVALDGRELARTGRPGDRGRGRSPERPGAPRRRRERDQTQSSVSGLPVWRRGVALLRQDPGLFPHLTVGENITYAAARRDAAQVDRLIERLQLRRLLTAVPGTVSGGQAQRIALARALVAEHRCLLLDEPYSGLDAPLRRELTDIVRDEASVGKTPAVLVAHELEAAQAFADRLGVLDGGRLLQVGPPAEVVRKPASRRVAELVGYRGFVSVECGAVGQAGRPLVAAVHPERVGLGANASLGPVLRGVLTASRPAGGGWELDVRVAGSIFSFRAGDEPGVVGAELELTLLAPPLFDSQGRAIAGNDLAAPR